VLSSLVMKILFTGANTSIANEANVEYSLVHTAINAGHQIVDSIEERPDLLICVDYKKSLRGIIQEANSISLPTVLIKQEPIVVFPQHAAYNPGNLFSLVITRGEPNNRPQFNTFQEWKVGELVATGRKNRLVAISGNKWSMVPGEYYSLRRQAYSKDQRIDLFGPGWNDTTSKQLTRVSKEVLIAASAGFKPDLKNLRWCLKKPLNYLGVSGNKYSTLAEYKGSLVIENNGGYMSEKLVDSIISGTVPVYVGAPVQNFGIPQDLVIEAEPNFDSISRAIDLAITWDSQDYIERVKTWLSKPGIREQWHFDSVNSRLLEFIFANTKS
jgi:hypothetical protein